MTERIRCPLCDSASCTRFNRCRALLPSERRRLRDALERSVRSSWKFTNIPNNIRVTKIPTNLCKVEKIRRKDSAVEGIAALRSRMAAGEDASQISADIRARRGRK